MTIIVCRCGKEALSRTAVERLPNGGILIKAVHEGGLEHTWGQYSSVYQIGQRKDRAAIYMKCPQCGHRGRIGQYRHNKSRPELVNYYIAHKKKTDKTWGIKQQQKAIDRHYINDPEKRDKVLRKLGLWLSPQHPPQAQIESKPRSEAQPIILQRQTL